MSAHDKERIARLTRSTDRTRSVMARWLALQAASRFVGGPWANLRLGRHHRGRPYVMAQPRLSLSMAHSGRYAVAAVALDGLVGVDVEEITRVTALPDSAFLTSAESSEMSLARDDGEGRAALWVLKESAMKMTGEGLRAGMRRVSFRRRAGERFPFGAQTDYIPGAFSVTRLGGGYVCAVGVSAGIPPAASLVHAGDLREAAVAGNREE
nr:4'-phosphopantetheinyl transferase superfamily protein [Streptomyces sp. NRRL F-5755]